MIAFLKNFKNISTYLERQKKEEKEERGGKKGGEGKGAKTIFAL